MSGPGPDLPAPLRDRKVFLKPWHATAFALVLALHAAGRFAWPDWVQAFAARDRAAPDRDGECPEDGYYRRVVEAVQEVLAAQGVAGAATLAALDAAWRAAYLGTPHGAPVGLAPEAVAAALAGAGAGTVPSHDHSHDHHHDHDHDHHHHAPRARRAVLPVAVSPAARGA